MALGYVMIRSSYAPYSIYLRGTISMMIFHPAAFSAAARWEKERRPVADNWVPSCLRRGSLNGCLAVLGGIVHVKKQVGHPLRR